MKKFFVLLTALILVAGLCFAQDEEGDGLPKPEKFDLEVSVGFPVHWTNGEHDDDFYPWNQLGYWQLDKTVTANTAWGAALMFNFGRKVGFTIDWDFFYSAKVTGFSNPTSDYNSMFGTNLLVAPVFFIYNSSFLRIPLAIGAHVYYFSDEMWMPYLDVPAPGPEGAWLKRRDLQIGPGLYLGVQFHFNNSVYIFSRTNVAIDIFRWHQAKWAEPNGPNDSRSEMEFVISWNVKPTLGLGIKF